MAQFPNLSHGGVPMCPIVGVDSPDPANPVSFELRVNDLVDKVVLEAEESFDPTTYFITSGDAVQKTKAMVKHLKARLQTANKQNARIWSKVLNQAETMLQLLEEVRGSACFLETEWGGDDSLDLNEKPTDLRDSPYKRRLQVIPKNPRVK